MKTAFYIIIGDSHYHGCRTDEFIKSFKNFHPDIDLIIFGQKDIDNTFSEDSRLNFYNSKATFAKKLYNDYDLVVNIDADHLILGELSEILIGDYDISAPANYNSHLNSGIGINSFASSCGVFKSSELIQFNKYIQGGLIASTSKDFWDKYEYMSLNYSDLFGNKENDILNIICHMLPYKFKVLEGAFEYTDPNFSCYYGCSALGRENQIVVSNGRLELDGKPIKAYHFAGGGNNKAHPSSLFSSEVVNFIYSNIVK